MKIICRPYLYKVVTPSQKGRVLTKWVEGQPLADFEAFEMTKVPLSVSNVEIENTYHEITRKRAEKLLEEKAQLLNPEIENISSEDPQD